MSQAVIIMSVNVSLVPMKKMTMVPLVATSIVPMLIKRQNSVKSVPGMPRKRASQAQLNTLTSVRSLAKFTRAAHFSQSTERSMARKKVRSHFQMIQEIYPSTHSPKLPVAKTTVMKSIR